MVHKTAQVVVHGGFIAVELVAPSGCVTLEMRLSDVGACQLLGALGEAVRMRANLFAGAKRRAIEFETSWLEGTGADHDR